MSNEDQNQDFEKLQRMLKVKRHELPPPRFFNDFSGKVTARLRAGDVGKLESFEDVVAQSPWLQRLWQAIEGKPAISGIFAAGVCGLLLAGMFVSGQSPNTMPALAENENKAEEPAQQTLFATAPLGMPASSSSTTPMAVLPGKSLFGSSFGIQTAPASGMPLRFATNGMPY